MSNRFFTSTRLRQVMLEIHRYVGLAMALFLIVAGITGSVIAFKDELDAIINPELIRVTPPSLDAQPLNPFALQAAVASQLQSTEVLHSVTLDIPRERSVDYWVNDRQVFVNPYTGQVLGSRKYGDLSEGKKNIITFLYKLHYTLALGDVGYWLMGIVALLWTLDCFVSAYLTFPRPAKPGPGPKRPWLRRWAPMWLLNTNKLFSLVFSWHRAGGLWIWGMLFVFAWSGVALNLNEQVYQPVMGLFLSSPEHVWDQLPELDRPNNAPSLSAEEALPLARRQMRAAGQVHGFDIIKERWLSYHPDHGVYSYWAETSLDISAALGETHVILDATSGAPVAFSARAGVHLADTIRTWLVALHFGAVRGGGLAYRTFVCLLGMWVVLLSITGVWIWWKKRRGRVRLSQVHAKGDHPARRHPVPGR